MCPTLPSSPLKILILFCSLICDTLEMVPLAILFFAAQLSGACAGYCTSSNSTCWPSASDWALFNKTISGKLIRITPVLEQCFRSKDLNICNDVVTKSQMYDYLSFWPAGYAMSMFEADPVTGDACIPTSPNYLAWIQNGSCPQGGTPYYGVAVSSAQDIAQTLSFAQKKNIQVIIKCSGHDFQGRSAGSKDSLMIWTSNFKGVDIQSDFTTGCSDSTGNPAVTISAGTRWLEVYSQVNASGYMVIGGTSKSVCPAGGWSAGGGHSPFSPAYGLGVDHVLQYTVVLANGTEATVNSCMHPDLFWAMRGGGGGTFAVVTTVTFKLHPIIPVTRFFLSGAFKITDQTSAALPLKFFSILLPEIHALTYGTYDVVAGADVQVVSGVFGTFTIDLVFNGTESQAMKATASLVNQTLSEPGFQVFGPLYRTYPSFFAFHLDRYNDLRSEGDSPGANTVSRLIPSSLCTGSGAAVLAQALFDIYWDTDGQNHYPFFEMVVVAGAGVAAQDSGSRATSVNPAWRGACMHLWLTDLNRMVDQISPYPYLLPLAEKGPLLNVSGMMGPVNAILPVQAAYFSESDIQEQDWEDVFWGPANYARLQTVKDEYDPKGVFSCHHCVQGRRSLAAAPAAAAAAGTAAVGGTTAATAGSGGGTPSPTTAAAAGYKLTLALTLPITQATRFTPAPLCPPHPSQSPCQSSQSLAARHGPAQPRGPSQIRLKTSCGMAARRLHTPAATIR